MSYWETYVPIGGDPALDFINSVYDRLEPNPIERLQSYDDFLQACVRFGTLEPAEEKRLRKVARANSEMATASHDEILKTRENIYQVFFALANESQPSSKVLDAFNAELTKALSHVRVVPDPSTRSSASGYPKHTWGWDRDANDLLMPVWPLVRAASELLTSDKLNRLHMCAGTGCDWIFLDLSRNRSRRWCDMKSCGNRAKARRFVKKNSVD